MAGSLAGSDRGCDRGSAWSGKVPPAPFCWAGRRGSLPRCWQGVAAVRSAAVRGAGWPRRRGSKSAVSRGPDAARPRAGTRHPGFCGAADACARAAAVCGTVMRSRVKRVAGLHGLRARGALSGSRRWCGVGDVEHALNRRPTRMWTHQHKGIFESSAPPFIVLRINRSTSQTMPDLGGSRRMRDRGQRMRKQR